MSEPNMDRDFGYPVLPMPSLEDVSRAEDRAYDAMTHIGQMLAKRPQNKTLRRMYAEARDKYLDLSNLREEMELMNR